MILSHHAAKRGRERLSVPHKAVLKLAERAWEKGLKSSEVSGSLRRFINGREMANGGAHIRVYGEYVYVFGTSEERKLITVIPLPHKYKAQLRRMRGYSEA